MKYPGFVIHALFPIIPHYFVTNHNFHKLDKMSLYKRYCDSRELMFTALKGLSCEIIATGEKLSVKQSYIITPNHTSLLDPLPLVVLSNQTLSFVGKKEVKKMPIVGKAMRSINGLFLDREDLHQEMKIMRSLRKSLQEDNIKWVIFPEGTRSKDPDKKMGDFKPGSFKMAMATGVDIVPVAIWGTFRVLDTKYQGFKKFPIYIHYCKPITKAEYEGKTTAEVAQMVHDIVENKLHELQEIDKANLNKYLKKPQK